MRSFLNEDNAVATFIHQMVPHHNNAVNMAKILLKMDVLDADDEDDAGMIDMLWAIINAQNYQNHNMEAYLDGGGYAGEKEAVAAALPALPRTKAAMDAVAAHPQVWFLKTFFAKV